jgi:hypothetical protein
MTEELQEIERLIKQSAELRDSLIRLARKLQVLQNTISRVGRQEDTRQVKATNDQAFIMYRERVLAFFQSPQMKLRWRNQISHGAQGLDTVKFLCRCRHRRNSPIMSRLSASSRSFGSRAGFRSCASVPERSKQPA